MSQTNSPKSPRSPITNSLPPRPPSTAPLSPPPPPLPLHQNLFSEAKPQSSPTSHRSPPSSASPSSGSGDEASYSSFHASNQESVSNFHNFFSSQQHTTTEQELPRRPEDSRGEDQLSFSPGLGPIGTCYLGPLGSSPLFSARQIPDQQLLDLPQIGESKDWHGKCTFCGQSGHDSSQCCNWNFTPGLTAVDAPNTPRLGAKVPESPSGAFLIDQSLQISNMSALQYSPPTEFDGPAQLTPQAIQPPPQSVQAIAQQPATPAPPSNTSPTPEAPSSAQLLPSQPSTMPPTQLVSSTDKGTPMKRGRSRRYDAPLAFADPQAATRIVELEKLLEQETKKLLQRSGTPLPGGSAVSSLPAGQTPAVSSGMPSSTTQDAEHPPSVASPQPKQESESLNLESRRRERPRDEPEPKRRRVYKNAAAWNHRATSVPNFLATVEAPSALSVSAIRPLLPPQPGTKVIVFVGFRDLEVRDLMEKVTALGGRGFVGSEDIFFPQATHVVAPVGSILPATMAARVNGRWVVTQQWVTDSYTNGQWLNEAGYGACKSSNSGKHGAFVGKRVYISQAFTQAHPLLAQQARTLVEVGQGIVSTDLRDAQVVLVQPDADREAVGQYCVTWSDFVAFLENT